jgi:hypothetical protein
MGSSDPLPARLEIRFGSLNFQATGNDYLMHITNRSELHPWRSTGPGPSERTLQAPQHRDTDGAPASAPDRRGWNDAGLRASPHKAKRPLAGWRPLPWGTAQFPSRSSPSACAMPRWRTPHLPAPTWQRVGAVLAATSRRPRTSPPPPTTSPTTAPPASCHPPLRTGTRSGTVGVLYLR